MEGLAFNCPHCAKLFQTNPSVDEPVYCPHCNEIVSLPEEEELAIGQTIGGFEVIKLIGRGGMGNVYLANQTSMEREVALKILPQSMIKDKTVVEQFLNEVKFSGRLHHPNIVSAIDAGEDKGVYYLALNYIDGYTLETKLENGYVFNELEALQYILKIAEALQYAWSQHNIYHKDIKPSNIMVNSNNEPFLMDMGIAQRLGDAAVEEKKHVEGSPFYMSPEQIQGIKLNWSTDLYSMGATLYNLVVGVPPYDAADITKIIEKHVKEPFPNPKVRNPKSSLNPSTLRLLKQMLNKKPQDRFPSWDSFIKAISKNIKDIKVKQSSNKRTKKSKEPTNRRTNKSKTSIGKRSASASKRSPIRVKKKSNPAVLIIILLFVLVGGGFAVHHIMQKSKIDNIKNIIRAAENSITGNSNYKKYIHLFRRAANVADGSELEQETRARLNVIKNIIALYHEYDIAYSTKNYKKAISVHSQIERFVNRHGLSLNKSIKFQASLIKVAP